MGDSLSPIPEHSSPPWPDKDYLASMKPVYEARGDLQSHCDNLRGLVQKVVTRNSFVLAGKYVGRVKEEEQRLGALVGRLQAAQSDLEHNPTIDSLTEQIKDLKGQVKAMEKRSFLLEQQASSLRTLLDSRSDAVSGLRQELNKLTKMNMSLSYEVDDQPRQQLRGTANRSIEVGEDTSDFMVLEDSRAQDGHISQLKDSIRMVEEEAEEVRTKETGLGELRVEGFFQKCVRAAKQDLLKSQELPKDSRGLQGSLYFELLGVREKPLADKGTYRSSLQDRDYKNVVYYTVKRMLSTARSSKKQQQLAAMAIPLSQLRNYAPMQIIGLLCLRPDVIQDLRFKVFPEPYHRLEGTKTHSPLPAIGSSRRLPRELHIARSRLGREVREKHSMSLV